MPIQLSVWFAFIGLGGAGAFVFSILVLRLTLTRRLKEQLTARDRYWNSGTLDFGFLNTAIFVWVCVFPYMTNFKNYQNIYPNLDVRSFANKGELFLAYVTVTGLVVFFLSGAFFYLAGG